MDRPARHQRHGDDRAAADRATLWRAQRARGNSRIQWPAGYIGLRSDSRLLENAAQRQRLRGLLAAHGTRRLHGRHRIPAQDGAREPRRHQCHIAGGGAAGGQRLGADLPLRPLDLRRPLRQQRLAARVSQAADQADVGKRRLHQPQHGAHDGYPRRAGGDGGCHRLSRQASASRALGATRPARRLLDDVPRLRAHALRAHRRRQGHQHLQPALLRCALLRRRRQAQQDGTDVQGRLDAGVPGDGGAQRGAKGRSTGARWKTWPTPRASARWWSANSHSKPRPGRKNFPVVGSSS